MLLVALGQGSSTNMKTTELVIYMTSVVLCCNLHCWRFLLEDEFLTKAQNKQPVEDLERKILTAPPHGSSSHACACRVALRAPVKPVLATRAPVSISYMCALAPSASASLNPYQPHQ